MGKNILKITVHSNDETNDCTLKPIRLAESIIIGYFML